MKIWSKLFLVIATGMMMFSSCLKNIEPEGLADLRGAKAELLRAQTAVEAANAAKINADAALVLAKAKVEEAIAKQEEAKALKLQYEAELAQAQNEAEKAALQARIAEIEAEALKRAEELKADLLYAQAATAEAQIRYEQALKDLALAAATLTDDQAKALENLQAAVDQSRMDVVDLMIQLEDDAVTLAHAVAMVDDEAAQKAVTRIAEHELVRAKATLEAMTEAEALVKEALELDPAVTDWEAKAEEYQAEADKLDAEYWKRYGEITDAMSAMEDSIDVDGAIAVKAAEYTEYTGYDFNDVTGLFSQLPDPAAVLKSFEFPEVVVMAPADAEGNVYFEDFVLDVTSYEYGSEDEVIEKFEDALKDLASYNAESRQALIDMMAEIGDIIEKEGFYKVLLTAYDAAVAAYKADDVLAYFNEYVFDEGFDLNAAVKEYNDALAALNAAVKNYEDNFEKYTPDFSAELKAAKDVRDKAYAVAVNARYAAYQKAYDDNKIAALTRAVEGSGVALGLAEATENSVKQAAFAATGETTVDAIKAYIDSYVAATATPEETVKYNLYVEVLAKINAATAVVKSATDTNKAAKADLEKATVAYEKAKTAADEVCDKAIAAAEEALVKAIIAIDAKAVGFDPDFKQNLIDQVGAAVAVLNQKVEVIYDLVSGSLMETYFPYYGDYEFYLTGEATSYMVEDIPAFMIAEEIIAAEVIFELKPIEVADVVNKSTLKTYIEDLVADLTTVGAYDNDSYAGYPFVLPSAEENIDFYYEHNAGLTDGDPVSPLYYDVIIEEGIAFIEAAMAAAEEVLPEYVKAIEAAKAEFEALVAENAAKLAADKAEVEAFYARYIPLKEKNDKELAAMKAKTDVMVAKYDAMVGVIEAYCTDTGLYYTYDDVDANGDPIVVSVPVTTVDELVMVLEDIHDFTIYALTMAEGAVKEAEIALDQAKAGLVTFAELAQMKYDTTATDLAIAMAKLEGATAALENAIAVIYGVEPVVPETPVTPDVPAGDDTTEEGGETEGGETEGEGTEGEGTEGAE